MDWKIFLYVFLIFVFLIFIKISRFRVNGKKILSLPLRILFALFFPLLLVVLLVFSSVFFLFLFIFLVFLFFFFVLGRIRLYSRKKKNVSDDIITVHRVKRK